MKKFLLKEVISGGYVFKCPACEINHFIDKRWSVKFIGDLPTVLPSLLTEIRGQIPPKKCHLFVRHGKLQYLNDCTHKLAGKTIDMVRFE